MCLIVCTTIIITCALFAFGNCYKTDVYLSTSITLYWPAAKLSVLIASQWCFNHLLLCASRMRLFLGLANFPKWIPGWVFPPLSLISLDGGLNFNLVIAATAAVVVVVFLCVCSCLRMFSFLIACTLNVQYVSGRKHGQCQACRVICIFFKVNFRQERGSLTVSPSCKLWCKSISEYIMLNIHD